MNEPRVRLHDTAGTFLTVATDHLLGLGVVANVVHTNAERLPPTERLSDHDAPTWFATVHDDEGAVVGAAMRTIPHPPYAPYVLPMPEAAALALAEALRSRGESVTAVNGASPSAEAFFTACTGHAVDDPDVEVERTRQHEVTTLVPPSSVDGRLRAPRPDEIPILVRWLDAFMAEADVQAGRAPGSVPSAPADPDDVAARAAEGGLGVWDVGGEAVHVLGTRGPSGGVARIGPVYTPPEQRGHGWASAAVAECSRRLLDDGARVCLFTDLANPTSNALYARLGFRPVGDGVQLRLRTGAAG